jgi:hypothetical protein
VKPRALAFVVAASVACVAGARAQTPLAPAPSVVAVVGESGLNVLHSEFRTPDGADPVYPAGMSAPQFVTLPGGDFAAALAELRAGPLAQMEPGTLYAVHGTRLLVYAPASAGASRSILGDPRQEEVLAPVLGSADPLLHGTGVVDAVNGTRYGTNPNAIVVLVPSLHPDDWEWVARQSWIDLATTSSYSALPATAGGTVDTADPSRAANARALCEGGRAIADMTRAGRIAFSSSGNTTDATEPLTAPNGLPDVYLVGGVDAQGKSWRPVHDEESDEFYRYGNVVRPYDTGERFSFSAAAPDSYDGTTHFGGTSGATPLTAGWASRIVQEARALLGTDGAAAGAFAVAAPGTTLPARGPLADGRFTRDELIGLLHHTAVAAEAASPARYFVEGFGAFARSSFDLSVAVLRGNATEPSRPDEDAARAQTQQLRVAAFAARCAT